MEPSVLAFIEEQLIRRQMSLDELSGRTGFNRMKLFRHRKTCMHRHAIAKQRAFNAQVSQDREIHTWLKWRGDPFPEHVHPDDVVIEVVFEKSRIENPCAWLTPDQLAAYHAADSPEARQLIVETSGVAARVKTHNDQIDAAVAAAKEQRDRERWANVPGGRR